LKHIGDTSNGLYKFLAFEAGAKNVTSLNLIKECNPFSSLDFPVINWYIKECDVKSLYSFSCLDFPVINWYEKLNIPLSEQFQN
jgi:hypothetical protein